MHCRSYVSHSPPSPATQWHSKSQKWSGIADASNMVDDTMQVFVTFLHFDMLTNLKSRGVLGPGVDEAILNGLALLVLVQHPDQILPSIVGSIYQHHSDLSIACCEIDCHLLIEKWTAEEMLDRYGRWRDLTINDWAILIFKCLWGGLRLEEMGESQYSDGRHVLSAYKYTFPLIQTSADKVTLLHHGWATQIRIVERRWDSQLLSRDIPLPMLE